MALPIGALIARAASAVVASGRGTFGASRTAAAAGRAARRYNQWSLFTQRPSPADDDRSPTHEEARESVRNFYQQARQTLGTPNPTAKQLGQVAREQLDRQQQRRDDEAAQQMRDRFRSLAKVAGVATAGIGSMALASRDYSSVMRARAESLRLFDTRIGAAAARSDVGALRRTFQAARDTGATTSALLDANRRRADAMQPFQSAGTNLGNVVRTAWTELQTKVIGALDRLGGDEAISGVARTLAKALGQELKKDLPGDEAQAFLKDWLRNSANQPTNRFPD